MATRWGICGTGLIANDFVTVLKALPASEHQVVAVAAQSDQGKADSFAVKFDIAAAYGSYQDMAKDRNVDIVYVATMAKEASILYLDHGKHVLCETPMTWTLKGCQEVIAKAREKKLFFMEAFATRFFPAYQAMVQEVDSGRLGDIVCVRAALVCPGRQYVESRGRAFTGGSLMSIGGYPLLYVQQFFKDRPEKVVAVGQFLEGGGDVGGAIVVQYKGGQLGITYFNEDAGLDGSTVTIHGTKGTVTIDGGIMHTPNKLTSSVTGESRDFPLPEFQGPFNWWNASGFFYEMQAVRQCLLDGVTECPQMTLDDSLTIMSMVDQAATQMGLQ